MNSQSPSAKPNLNAECSKFPPINASNGVESDPSLSNSSPTNHQLIDDTFPSPPSTSTGSQQNISSNADTPSRASGGNLLNFLFRGRKSDTQRIQNFISNEGSITVGAWKMLSKQENSKVRLRTLETLATISQQRKLQVSTLEGIWNETHDMLEDPVARVSFLNLIYKITTSQITEIGIALRLTFFETIRSIGPQEITIKWLTALVDEGKVIDPFELSIFEVISDWMEKIVIGPNNKAINLEVIQLCSNLIRYQHAFIREESLSRIFKCCFKRLVKGPGNQLGPYLDLLETIFKHCVILKSELFSLVTSLCFIICLDVEAEKTWNLFSFLLTSEHSYSVLTILQKIMTTFVKNSSEHRREIAVQIARGSVYGMAQALFGAKRIESLNCSPSVVLPAFEDAMFTDVMVARQVLHAIRRLVVKHGKTLDLFVWTGVNKLLRSAVLLCGEDVEVSAIIKHDVHSVLSIVEILIERNEYGGSTEEFYSILEESIIDRPDHSAMNLLDYRISKLTPENDNWIDSVHRLLINFLYEGSSQIRRQKAVYAMHNFTKKYKVLYENEILTKIVLPICNSMIPKEIDTSVQYYLLCVLFDVAKISTINLGGSNDLFMSILAAIKTAFNGINLDNDNLEVSACLLSELLDERWAVLDINMAETIFDIMIKHLELHYTKMNASTSGCEVRKRIFESLLLFQSHPLNGQIARVLIVTPTQFKPVYNSRIIRAGADTQGQFKWTSICQITILGLKSEIHWPTLERILEFLSGVVEHRLFVYTAGEENVNKLVDAVLNVPDRFPLLSKSRLARYLCPVIAKLLNYTNSHDNQICKIIVQLVTSSSPQALMACASAIQVLPSKMATFNRSLLENLASLKPMAQLAVPIIELLNDAADVYSFFEFFQDKHFKMVINILAPYSNSRQYNTFIVTSIYQTAMKWFVCVPMDLRASIAAYMFGSLAKVNNLYPPLQKSNSSGSPESPDLTKKSTTLPEVDSSHPTALIITPSKKRNNIKKYTNNHNTDQNSLENDLNSATAIGELYLQSLSDSPKSLERNPSGDGRMVHEMPFDDGNPMFSTGDTVSLETDSISDFRGINELAQQILAQEYANQQQDLQRTRESYTANLTIECLENFNYFIRFFRTKTLDTINAQGKKVYQVMENNEDMVEKCVENWIVDGTVLTLRVFVRPEISSFGLHSRRIATISVDRLDASGISSKAGRAALAIQSANRMNRSMSREKTPSIATPKRHKRNPSTTSKESDELLRRRHQSTKDSTNSSTSPQKSTKTMEEITPNTASSDLEDVFSTSNVYDDKSPEWIQLIIRHVFGKESYIMRSFVDMSPDLDNVYSCMSDPTSLLLHLRGNHSTAVHLQQKDNDLIGRSLRFLDTMPSEELHEICVVYLSEQHSTIDDMLKNEFGSDRFAAFVRRLGNPIGSTSSYEHVDLLQRIQFHVLTMIPCANDSECEEKRNLIENTQICVVFNESGSSGQLNQLFRKNDQVALEVTPQDDSTVTLNIHSKKEIGCWLAMSRALLPDSQAAHVLRKIIVRAQRSLRCWSSELKEESSDTPPYLNCAIERQRHIHKLRKRGVTEPF